MFYEVVQMKFCVLMGSPRSGGNTAALLAPFLEECAAVGGETGVISLYDKTVNPCLGLSLIHI